MTLRSLLFITAFMLFAGCAGQDPQPIEYGKDNCTFCQMLITDHEFGSELITPKGKAFKFDSIECLVAYAQMPDKYDPKASAVYVTSMLEPDVLFDARSAMFVISKEIDSPMGANLAAFRSHADATKTVRDSAAVHYTWEKLLSTKLD